VVESPDFPSVAEFGVSTNQMPEEIRPLSEMRSVDAWMDQFPDSFWKWLES
jgi:hypothetical protein